MGVGLGPGIVIRKQEPTRRGRGGKKKTMEIALDGVGGPLVETSKKKTSLLIDYY